MYFDPENKIIKLCAEGMALEGAFKQGAAAEKYAQAWQAAENDFEKFTAAHYLARQQPGIKEKLEWDKTALEFALKLNDEAMKGSLPSLYLNIAKCYEDLGNLPEAQEHYMLAQSYTRHLPNDGYGNMIRSGILKGMERTGQQA